MKKVLAILATACLLTLGNTAAHAEEVDDIPHVFEAPAPSIIGDLACVSEPEGILIPASPVFDAGSGLEVPLVYSAPVRVMGAGKYEIVVSIVPELARYYDIYGGETTERSKTVTYYVEACDPKTVFIVPAPVLVPSETCGVPATVAVPANEHADVYAYSGPSVDGNTVTYSATVLPSETQWAMLAYDNATGRVATLVWTYDVTPVACPEPVVAPEAPVAPVAPAPVVPEATVADPVEPKAPAPAPVDAATTPTLPAELAYTGANETVATWALGFLLLGGLVVLASRKRCAN